MTSLALKPSKPAKPIKAPVFEITETPTGTWKTHHDPKCRTKYSEFRSNAELFGKPLVSIVQGIDPRTRKMGIADGHIAIGQRAQGTIAIGQFCNGYVFALGQFCTSRFAAIGQFVAAPICVGQFTFGVLSVGQFAIALLAVAQMAISANGVYQFGMGFGELLPW